MAATLPPSLFLTTGSSYDAAVQLVYKLPGQYRLVRRTHHANIVQGTHLSHRDLISPSHGISDIVFRASTDRAYEVELLQTTTVYLRTRTGQSATKIERRAFRITNGRWSVWAVAEGPDDPVVAGGKLTDLVLGEVPAPEQIGPTGLDVVQKAGMKGEAPWLDGWGLNTVAMCVWVGAGRPPCWRWVQQVERPGGAGWEVCNDEFWPAVEGAR